MAKYLDIDLGVTHIVELTEETVDKIIDELCDLIERHDDKSSMIVHTPMTVKTGGGRRFAILAMLGEEPTQRFCEKFVEDICALVEAHGCDSDILLQVEDGLLPSSAIH